MAYTPPSSDMPIASPTIGTQFDPAKYINTFHQAKRQLQVKNMEKELANEAKFNAMYDPSKLVPKEINQWNEEEIGSAIDAIDEQLISEASKNRDAERILSAQTT